MLKIRKLEKKDVQDIISLSPIQQGMLFHYINNPLGENYFEQLCLRFQGNIDINKIKEAWKPVVQANEMLRTIFRWEKLDKPVQVVLDDYELPLNNYDLTELSYSDREKRLKKILSEDKARGIDIRIEPLRISLIKLSDDILEMVISSNHILFDGWSNGIIIREFIENYNHLLEGRLAVIKSKNTYKEFVKWQQKQDMPKQKEYWEEYLKGFDTKTEIPLDKNRTTSKSTTAKYSHSLSKDTSERFQKFARDNKVTLAALLYCAWGLLLQKYNDNQDVIFGTTVSGRTAKLNGIEDMVGLFINTIPLRVQASKHSSMHDILMQVNESLKQREEYGCTPLVEIGGCSELHSSNLFDSIVVFENYPIEKLFGSESSLKLTGFSAFEATNFDLNLAIMAFEDIEFNFIYNKEKFYEETIRRMSVYYERILIALVENAVKCSSDIELFTAEDRSQLLLDFSSCNTDYPRSSTLHELFEEQAQRYPDKVALIQNDSSITYETLNKRANQLARTLRAEGVKEDSIVGILVERSVEMIIGILAILKAGGAYLPIDPSYPEERTAYILRDSEVKILLTQTHLHGKEWEGCSKINMDNEDLYKGEASNLEPLSCSESLAYVMYTSGSTGKPKGNLTTHYNISRVIKNTNYIDIKHTDCLLQLSNYAFDGSTFDIFGALLNGATLVLVDKESVIDLNRLAKIITTKGITVFFVTTALFNTLVDINIECLSKVRKILFGGERVSVQHAVKALEYLGSGRLLHMYGPTESTVFATWYPIDAIDQELGTVPIGKPIANTYIYILDKHNSLMPIGGIGEICIGGDGLVRGYLNRPELTSEKFIKNPFINGERLYKTGDLAKWLPDGSIEFVGRIDHQVKLRGFRIELGEIESSLLTHDAINEAIVIDKKDAKGNVFLCAYYSAKADLSVDELRDYLLRELPEYMLPAYFVAMDKLPLNLNGKIDRKALPEPMAAASDRTVYQAPRNELEAKLAVIWKDILGVKDIGINDNFFELGGHSLKATALAARLQKEMNIEVPLGEIFKNASIKDLAEYVLRQEVSKDAGIMPAELKEAYKLSQAQLSMFVQEQFEGIGTAYNMPFAMMVEGAIDADRVEYAFKELIKRHDVFRTEFQIHNGEPAQFIKDEVDFKLSYAELKTDIDSTIKEFIKPFKLNKAPLLRVGLYKLKENQNLLLLDMHHIAADGVSISIILNEFRELYEGRKLPEVKLQYKDFSEWQNGIMSTDYMKRQEAYWESLLSSGTAALNMPLDGRRSEERSFEGSTVKLMLPQALSNGIERYAQSQRITLNAALFGIYAVLLNKYTQQEDITIGSLVAGRRSVDTQSMVGMFNNFLPIRCSLYSEESFSSFSQKLGEVMLKAYENQEYPYDKMVDRWGGKTERSRNPLFDTMLILHNQLEGDTEFNIGELSFKHYELESKTSKLDFKLDIYKDKQQSLNCIFEYNTRLFRKETIEGLAAHFEAIVRQVIANPSIKLSEIDMLTELERVQVLKDFNATKTYYPDNVTLHQLFEQQVELVPDSIAALFGDKELSFRELNRRANRLARTLKQKGVKADSIVAMLMDRSLEMTVGIMGILKAGGAYLPISPEYPEDRIKYVIEDSGAQILLTQSHLLQKTDVGAEVVNLEDEASYHEDSSSLEPVSGPRNLAYVIYTSGSTGKPKGAMIEHHSAVNRIKWMHKSYPIEQGDVILQKTPYTFDVSVWELFWWAMEGAAVAFLVPGGEKDPAEIVSAIERYGITTMHFVPSMLNMFLEYIDGRPVTDKLISLRQVFASGEALTLPQVEKFNRLLNETIGARLINLYGPTEATVDVSYFNCSEGEKLEVVPIGKPIDNIKLLVVNKHNQLMPVGVPGELCISGVGVGRGYLNRPELTAEKFVSNPFSGNDPDYAVMYRTGDLARWMPDGNIEYLGRLDHQVKIRGFRIELGEIEGQLLKHKEIKEAVVTAREDKSGNKYLCGYIVSDRELTVAELREHILKDLPDYMVPAYFVRLETMPLSANGKADRKQLPEPSGSIQTGAEYVAPRNEVEEKLAAIWQELLQQDKIGIDYDFSELGGHSLKAIMLLGRIHKEFNAELQLHELFKSTTIRTLAEALQSSGKSLHSAIEPTAKRDFYPLSSAQKRLFILNKIEKESTNYNLPEVMLLEGRLDKERFESALKRLTQRHESLRTSFAIVQNEPVQIVHDSVEIDLKYLDIESGKNIDAIINGFIRPFDLSKAPLLRVCVASHEKDKHLLMFDIHHIVSDGVSIVVLVKEFLELYQGRELSDLRLQYRDYAEWQNRLLEGEAIRQQKEYWLKVFSDDVPVLNMPNDYQRPSMQSFEGDRLSIRLDEKLTKGLRELSGNKGATLYMTLMSIYNIVLSKYTGQEDIVVGSPIVGRPHTDLENIIGMFVNTLAMRNKPEAHMQYGNFLEEVKKSSIEAFENQDFPFEQLVDSLKLNKDLSRNPLFDTMLVLQNMNIPQLELDELSFKPYKFERKVAKFDITVEAVERGEQLILNFEYNTRLFRKETIEGLAAHFEAITRQIIANPSIKLSEIDMLTELERVQVLKDFNATKTYYPDNVTLHQLFEQQAEQVPDSIAAVFGDKELSFRELNQRANRLARTLRQKGVKADSIVAMLMDRSLEMTVGIMGILKAGGAYLPISPDYPEDRIKYVIEDSGAQILLTQSHLLHKSEVGAEVINLDEETSYHEDGSNLEPISGARSLAYVIYTSGSTGKPKGAMIEHHSAVNRIKWMHKSYPIEQGDVILQKTPYTFDVSVWELFWWAMEGAAVAFLVPGGEKDPAEIVSAIERYGITTMHFVPSMLNMFLEYIDGRPVTDKLISLRQVFASGEALTLPQVEKFNRLLNETIGARLINLYGPTEATVDVSYFNCSEGEKLEVVPIGKPIDNIKLLVVNKHNQLMPVGVPGELCISGVGVGRGYLNRPELTAEKFVSNPYSGNDPDYAVMYRTGDLARWMPDGNIEYLGRLDHQVKIRGFRIELGEIEGQLLKHKEIKEAVVTAREDNGGNKYLCGYIVSDRELTVAELREHILKDLPDYMVPAYFVRLEAMPLSANGKADRKQLPEPNGSIQTGAEYVEPRNEVEEKLAAIWQELLQQDKIGIHDNFFDLGGNSLLLIRMHSRLEAEGLAQDIKVTDIFANPTVSKLAEFIESTAISDLEELPIKELKLPSDYFGAGTANGPSTFKFRLEGVDKAKRIAKSVNVEVEDVFLSSYAYLMSQLSGSQEIAVQGLFEGDKIKSMEVPINKVKDFQNLFKLVNEIKNQDTGSYSLDKAEKASLKRSENAVVPLFYRSELMTVKPEQLRVYDILVEIKEEENHVQFKCQFNNKRLREDKMQHLINGYVKLSQQLLKNYDIKN